MNGEKLSLSRLTERQKKLVEDNVGLVAVHLRRHVGGLGMPRRDREREDLFQEGCLGLIQAAIRHQPEQGVPFAAFALSRIHNAVSRALQTRFSTVYVPHRRSRPRGSESTGTQPDPVRPGVCSIWEDLERRLVDPRHALAAESGVETVGQRLRDKYLRAVHRAGDVLGKGASTRGDRDQLVRILVEQRFLVPNAEERTALRQIARDTSSSYARVAQCEKQLAGLVRSTLDGDPEFPELRRRTRRDPLGVDLPVDEELERELISAGGKELVRRFHDASPEERAGLLQTVLEVSNSDLEGVIRSCFTRAPPAARRRLLEETAGLRHQERAKSPHNRGE